VAQQIETLLTPIQAAAILQVKPNTLRLADTAICRCRGRMPLYISVSPDKLARRRRFFKSLSLVNCRADEKFSIVRHKLAPRLGLSSLMRLGDSGGSRVGQVAGAAVQAQAHSRHRKCEVFPDGFRSVHSFYVEIPVEH
jgi:hypothetical protein